MAKLTAITGGTGLIGSKLCKALKDKGYETAIISRSPDKAEKEVPSADEYVSTDSDLKDLFERAYAVVNLAGASLAGKRWTDEYKKLLVDSRLQMTGKVVDAIKRAENKPAVLISSSGVDYYGESRLTKDESAPSGKGFLPELCDKWEAKASEADEFTRVVRVRTGVVFARGAAAFEKLTQPFKFFVGGPIGSGKQFFSWIHIEDAIELLIYAIENENISGALNLTSPNPVTMEELAHAIGDAMRRPSFFRVPNFSLKLVMGEAAEMILKGQKVIPKKAQDNDFKFKFDDIDRALADLL